MARRSVLNRSFSTSEKVLMLVLAVLLLAAAPIPICEGAKVVRR